MSNSLAMKQGVVGTQGSHQSFDEWCKVASIRGRSLPSTDTSTNRTETTRSPGEPVVQIETQSRSDTRSNLATLRRMISEIAQQAACNDFLPSNEHTVSIHDRSAAAVSRLPPATNLNVQAQQVDSLSSHDMEVARSDASHPDNISSLIVKRGPAGDDRSSSVASQSLAQLSFEIEKALNDWDVQPEKQAEHSAIAALEAKVDQLEQKVLQSERDLHAVGSIERQIGTMFANFEVMQRDFVASIKSVVQSCMLDIFHETSLGTRLSQSAIGLSFTHGDQILRDIEEIRTMHDIAQRRTEEALSQTREAVERLSRLLALNESGKASLEHRRAEGGRIHVTDVTQMNSSPKIELTGEKSSCAARKPAERSAPRSDASCEPASLCAVSSEPFAVDASAPLNVSERRIIAPRRVVEDNASGTVRVGYSGWLGRAGSALAKRWRLFALGFAAFAVPVGTYGVEGFGIRSLSDRPVGIAGSATDQNSMTTFSEGNVPGSDDVVPSKKVTVSAEPPFSTFAVTSPAAVSSRSEDEISDGLRSRAISGDASAEYEIGLRYAEGRGVLRNPKEAVTWLSKAAAQGSAPAAYRLGSAYEKGFGVGRDPDLATNWYERSAESGNVKAMHNLAVMEADGVTGKPDFTRAARLFLQASSYGLRDSQYNLAILYSQGLGVEQSLPKSYMWFATAASSGDGDAAKRRDDLAAKLDAASLAAAKAAADAFKPMAPSPLANDIASLQGDRATVTADNFSGSAVRTFATGRKSED